MRPIGCWRSFRGWVSRPSWSKRPATRSSMPNRRRVADAPTVLVYGHYDVQPPDPLAEWISPPFEPTVRDGNVYARGATDDKGQMLTHVKSAEAWLKTAGRLAAAI